VFDVFDYEDALCHIGNLGKVPIETQARTPVKLRKLTIVRLCVRGSRGEGRSADCKKVNPKPRKASTKSTAGVDKNPYKSTRAFPALPYCSRQNVKNFSRFCSESRSILTKKKGL
jgi:hypothetical protein